MYIGFESIAVSDTVLKLSDLTVPPEATGAELHTLTGGVRYTMDNTTDPTVSAGMLILAASSPKYFSIEDINRMKFIRDGAVNNPLNIHYIAGRDI